ncbi:carboxypeptidase-like regulatory domain-containing protein [Sanguibacter sp. 25GB23B1]|uniref:carboxypeptidase-like regulatory domain-containing protein n=1 Tax=unclassified Sanguibacter TaxID=2645534 RepID=UPI0032AF2E36
MRVSLSERRISVVPGSPSYVTVTVTNTSQVIAGYSLRFLGADPSWVTVDDPDARLFPDASAEIRVGLTLPVGVPAGARRMAVQVREATDEQVVAIEEIVVTVPEQPGLQVRLDPATVTAGRRGEFGVVVENQGNTILRGRLRGVDAEDKIAFAFAPDRFRLAPGEHLTTTLRTTARRPVFGALAVRPFGLFVDDAARTRRTGTSSATTVPSAPSDDLDGDATTDEQAAVPAASGVFIQKPRFARSALSLVGLLVAVTVFAVVISLGLSSVLARSAADRDLALQVAQAQFSDTSSGTAGIAGTVLLLSDGQPVDSVSVEVFDESDTSAAIATTATGADGTFAIGSLPAGSYKIRLLGSGFAEVWYPSAVADADAEIVDLTAGERVTGLSVLLGGIPATLSGTVTGADVAGATAQLQIPLEAQVLDGLVDPTAGAGQGAGAEPGARGNGAVVRTVPVGADGQFSLTSVPSPGVYDLVVSKAGFSTQVHRIDVAAGENRDGIEVSLLDGDGSVTGRVVSGSGPVPGATVVATYGQTVVQTVSLTQDDVGGFTLRGLPTPGTFTVVVSAPGYAPATLSVNLGDAQQLSGVVVTLGQSSGTLTGLVSTPGGVTPAGITVTVSDGAVTRQTVTQSSAPAGAWRISGLPLPSTYTVTFSRADLASQVVSVTIDGHGTVSTGASAVSGVDVAMRVSSARIVGVVSQAALGGAPQPAGNVQVTASSGTSTFSVTSASTPEAARGSFVLENVPPGTYTVTFSRKGTRSTSSIVTLTAGQTATLNPQLVSPASISGTVRANGLVAPGLELRLYTAQEYGTAAAPRMVTRTDATGRYLFEDVDAPAHYIIEVMSASGAAALETSTAITLGQSDAAIYDFTLDATS